MRGRIDKAEGFVVEPRPPSAVNLIQEAKYNQAIIKTFRILERSPSPTFGQEILPVCIVEDLRDAIHGSGIKWIAAGVVLSGAASFNAASIRNAPSGPAVYNADDDRGPGRVIIERIMIRSSTVGATVELNPIVHLQDAGNYAVAFIGEANASMKNNADGYRYPGAFPATNNPKLGMVAAFFSAMAGGGAANGAEVFAISENPWTEIDGPIVLEPNYMCTLTTSVATAISMRTVFQGVAYP